MKQSIKSIVRLIVFAIAYAISYIFANQAQMYLYIHVPLSIIAIITVTIAIWKINSNKTSGIDSREQIGILLIRELGTQIFVTSLSYILAVAFGTILRVGTYIVYEAISFIFVFVPIVMASVEPNKYE